MSAATHVSIDESEKSFFRLCELSAFQVDQYVIEHNLNHWNMTVSSAYIKGDRICVDVRVPYSEMNLELEEKMGNPEFFNKNTGLIRLSNRINSESKLTDYFMSKTVTLCFNRNIRYLLLFTPYFYPHNYYLLGNKEYLYSKITNSVNLLTQFMRAYRDTFQSGVPLAYVKSTRETRNHYEISLILKEYLTISYVKTDPSISTIYFHLLLEKDKKTNTDISHVAKYHNILIRLPREIRTGVVYIKFTANVV